MLIFQRNGHIEGHSGKFLLAYFTTQESALEHSQTLTGGFVVMTTPGQIWRSTAPVPERA